MTVMPLAARLAWRNLWRRPKRTVLMLLALAFCNGVLVLLMSLQVATYAAIIDGTLGFGTGHVRIEHQDRQDADDIRLSVPNITHHSARLRDQAGLRASATARAFALVISESQSLAIPVLGKEAAYESLVSSLPNRIKHGRYLRSGAAEAVIGVRLAAQLNVEIGDELTLLGSGMDYSLAADVLTVVGIVESGFDSIDRLTLHMPIERFDLAFSMLGHGHWVSVVGDDALRSTQLVDTLRKRFVDLQQSPIRIVDWDQLAPGLKQSILADISASFIMYLILILLVSFHALNAQMMSVIERTGEFGVSLALGLAPGKLARIVILESLFIGVAAALIGIVIGSAVVLYLSATGLQLPGLEAVAERFNLPPRLYPYWSLTGALIGPVAVTAALLLATVWPAQRIRNLHPITAMKSGPCYT
ncbi:MAG: transporter [Lysobacteraceae bacterium]|nr:MAG: transporter [Xanthomonadaceae bacterium]